MGMFFEVNPNLQESFLKFAKIFEKKNHKRREVSSPWKICGHVPVKISKLRIYPQNSKQFFNKLEKSIFIKLK